MDATLRARLRAIEARLDVLEQANEPVVVGLHDGPYEVRRVGGRWFHVLDGDGNRMSGDKPISKADAEALAAELNEKWHADAA